MTYRVLIYIFLFLLICVSPTAVAQKSNNKPATKPIVTLLSSTDNHYSLQGCHIALWNSHGQYYNQIKGEWIWQRARLMGTVEDMHTTDYVLNYITPMLENAGANVFIPRERDYNTDEYIIDNDTPRSLYSEVGDWKGGRAKGFAHTQEFYEDFTNPFKQGTYRWVKSTKDNPTATVTWTIPVAQSGRYAVYISYSQVKNGSTDARYTVYHAGGSTSYSVNQTMGGGTWIYLGSFDFVAGGDNRVVLTNQSDIAGQYITADALKVGGGMGNIARKPCLKPRKATKQALNNKKAALKKRRKKSKTKEEKKANVEVATVSGKPRYAEAARYWMQWAGVPDTIYSDTGGDNDYGDDTRGRSYWVNYLCGGSKVLPDSVGLSVPIDLAFAFHSDAGNVPGDSIIGSMHIYYTGKKKRRDLRYANGTSREQSKRLAGYINSMIQRDLNTTVPSGWNVRKDLDRRYAEARLLDVPTVLLESMSHQNFADMQYGLDPRFKFVMSRAIYKGILKYLSKRHHTPYIVQPLPVDHLALQWDGSTNVAITWQAVNDSLEHTATPTHYKVYTRRGEYGWDNGVVTTQCRYSEPISNDTTYSFYITAVNGGGESFPSEILSAHRSSKAQQTVMIINAFDRISAPYAINDTASNMAGFLHDIDGGVPYKHTVAYTGKQYNFDRQSEWVDDQHNPGFGASLGDYDALLIAGNTFDYPYKHGTLISRLGYSFLSASDEAVSDLCIELTEYPYIDIILGKERATALGNDSAHYDYEALPQPFTDVLTRYCHQGGNMLISGAYIGQDAYEGNMASESAQDFINNILCCEWFSARSAHNNSTVSSIIPQYENFTATWNSQPNKDCYAVEQTDILAPANTNAVTFMQYADGNSAAVATINDVYRCCTLAFPIEAIESEQQRYEILKLIFNFLNNTNSQ